LERRAPAFDGLFLLEQAEDFDIYILKDGDIKLPLSRMFPDVDESQWKKYAQVQQGTLACLSSGCVLLRRNLRLSTDEELATFNNVLIDTGHSTSPQKSKFVLKISGVPTQLLE